MKIKIFFLYILFSSFFTAGIFAVESTSPVQNQDREEMAREYYQKGLELANAGNLDEARAYFEKAIHTSQGQEPAGKTEESNGKGTGSPQTLTIKQQADLINGLKKENKERGDQINKQAEDMYHQALELYKAGKLEEAKKKLDLLSLVTPDYKETQKYLIRINRAITQVRQEKQRQDELAFRRERAQELKDRTDQTEKTYEQAVSLYRDHQWEKSMAQFETVEQMNPDYRHTHRYLERIGENISRPALVTAPAPSPKAQANVAVSQPVKKVVTLEDQQKQAQEISSLAEKSAQLFNKIAGIADDSATAQTKRKMARVDEVLSRLKTSKDRLVRHMLEEQFRRQQEERRIQVEKMYQQALEYLRSDDYTNAKTKFLGIESLLPDYKYTHRYLSRIEDEQKKEGVKAIIANDQKEAEYLKQLETKQNTRLVNQAQLQQEERERLQQEQQEALTELAQKASDINDDIIRLSKTQDYEAMKTRFTELENTVSALTVLKDAIAKEKGIHRPQKEITGKPIVMLPLEKHQASRLATPSSRMDAYKRREIVQEQNTLLKEGIDRYEHKKYTQAKLLFGELANLNDHRAESWLKKVDRAITRELLRSQEGEVRERTAFIAEQVKAQRELLVIQERERQRQKKLTEELERQKRVYEDNHLLDLRKEEMMKTQVREREVQEGKRLQSQKENEKQQEIFRFHKIKTPVNPPPELKPQMKPQVKPQVIKPLAAPSPSAGPKPADIKAKEETRRNELRLEQRQKREERIKQVQIARDEARRRKVLEKEEHERQAKLEAERGAIRKQLEDGVEVMYQEALSLYQQREYTAAADKFKDVQDILPGYKRAGEYMDQARLKSINTSGGAPDFIPASPAASRENDVTKALDLFDTNVK